MTPPIFPSEAAAVDPDLCFVLMPFDPQFSLIYDQIRGVIEDYARLKCLRADDLHTPSRITDDIWNAIRRARFSVADLTGSNPNVFYEVGMCHAINRPVVLMLQDGDKAPFDISHIRYLKYSVDKLPDLRSQLIKHVRACLSSMPESWNKAQTQAGPDVRITGVEAPSTAVVGQLVNIRVTAKNFGATASQGYFSVSFPSYSRAPVLKSDLPRTKTGVKGSEWSSGQVILRYPIGEALVYNPAGDPERSWARHKAHFLSAEIPERPGLLQFYVSASSKSGNGPFATDPKDGHLLDQREEPVYCGVIDIHPAA